MVTNLCFFGHTAVSCRKMGTNEDSNDLPVIRVWTQSLITLIPVGSRPRSLAIKLF